MIEKILLSPICSLSRGKNMGTPAVICIDIKEHFQSHRIFHAR